MTMTNEEKKARRREQYALNAERMRPIKAARQRLRIGRTRELQSLAFDKMFGWDLGTHSWNLDIADKCNLCGRPFEDTVALRKVTDHNHQTGEFRGIIHHKCNVGIGQLEDNAERCLQAAAYLRN